MAQQAAAAAVRTTEAAGTAAVESAGYGDYGYDETYEYEYAGGEAAQDEAYEAEEAYGEGDEAAAEGEADEYVEEQVGADEEGLESLALPPGAVGGLAELGLQVVPRAGRL